MWANEGNWIPMQNSILNLNFKYDPVLTSLKKPCTWEEAGCKWGEGIASHYISLHLIILHSASGNICQHIMSYCICLMIQRMFRSSHHSIYLSPPPPPALVYLFQVSALFCTDKLKVWPFLTNFVENLRTFWCTFTGLNDAVVPQNWQISGMSSAVFCLGGVRNKM